VVSLEAFLLPMILQALVNLQEIAGAIHHLLLAMQQTQQVLLKVSVWDRNLA
jgi:hypothetical protein